MPEENRTDAPEAHDHGDLSMPAEDGARFGAPGPLNTEALGLLVGAAIDGCIPCQEASFDRVASDPATLTRLVELSAIAVAGMAGGGLPPNMLTEDDAQSTLGDPYRAILRAGDGAGDDHTGMYALAVQLTEAERRQVADDALDVLTGVLMMGS